VVGGTAGAEGPGDAGCGAITVASAASAPGSGTRGMATTVAGSSPSRGVGSGGIATTVAASSAPPPSRGNGGIGIELAPSPGSALSASGSSDVSAFFFPPRAFFGFAGSERSVVSSSGSADGGAGTTASLSPTNPPAPVGTTSLSPMKPSASRGVGTGGIVPPDGTKTVRSSSPSGGFLSLSSFMRSPNPEK